MPTSKHWEGSFGVNAGFKAGWSADCAFCVGSKFTCDEHHFLHQGHPPEALALVAEFGIALSSEWGENLLYAFDEGRKFAERPDLKAEIVRLVIALNYAHSEGFEWPVDPLPTGCVALAIAPINECTCPTIGARLNATEAEADEAIKVLERAIEAARNSNQAGENAVVRAAAALARMEAREGGDGETRLHRNDDSPTAESGDAQ